MDFSFVTTACKRMSCVRILASIVTFTGICACIALIVGYSIDLYRHGKQKHYIGWFSSAGFVLLTIPISIRLIVQHLTHWTAPHVQKYVVRIIWMVPIYAVESWIALRFKTTALYLEKLRECYEAYVIFCFMYYLIALLGGDEHQIALKLRNRSSELARPSSWFSCIFGPQPTGADLLRRCKFGVFQYVIIKNLTAVIACILESLGIANRIDFQLSNWYVYQCFITNLSQLWALYCLVLFYVATRDDLHHWRPVGKFLCVKSVVFFTWWQSLLIEILFASPSGQRIADHVEDHWTVNEISKGIQDYLICIEMFFASLAFSFAFSYKDYIGYDAYRHHKRHLSTSKNTHNTPTEEPAEARPFLSAFFQSSIPDDIVNDFRKLARFSQFSWTKLSVDEENNIDDDDDGNDEDDSVTEESIMIAVEDDNDDGIEDNEDDKLLSSASVPLSRTPLTSSSRLLRPGSTPLMITSEDISSRGIPNSAEKLTSSGNS